MSLIKKIKNNHMKTSNKLLLGLLIVVILGILAANFILKKKIESKSKEKIELNSDSTSVNTADSDSIAMESAINNE